MVRRSAVALLVVLSCARAASAADRFAAQYAKLPRLHFALHDSARHFIMWDDPMWFFDELGAFFADAAARVRSRGF